MVLEWLAMNMHRGVEMAGGHDSSLTRRGGKQTPFVQRTAQQPKLESQASIVDRDCDLMEEENGMDGIAGL
jgi:hypothetical protein